MFGTTINKSNIFHEISPQMVIQGLNFYLSSISYEIEYFFEGYAIFFTRFEDPQKILVLFYNFDEKSFSISTGTSKSTQIKEENIRSLPELTKTMLKYFMEVEKLEELRHQLKKKD